MKRVDPSLANGSARMSLRALADETRKVFAASRAMSADPSAPSGRPFRTKAIREWQSRMAPIALFSRFDRELGYGGSAAIVLFVADNDQTATIFAQYLTGTRGEGRIRYLDAPIASITQHALARMNQRIGQMRVADIVALLTPSISLLLAMAVTVGNNQCLIRQVSVPFADGVLRCDIDEGKHIVIKTYISNPSSREEPLVNELQQLLVSLTTKRIDAFLWFPLLLDILMVSKSPRLRKPLIELAELGAALDQTFRRHHWLAEPYSKRPDPEGEVWEFASRSRSA